MGHSLKVVARRAWGKKQAHSPSTSPFGGAHIRPTFLLLAALCCAPALSFAHGGIYRGPGSTVPPGGGGGSGPSSPGGPGGAPVSDWRVWWSFNRDPYLQVKRSVHGEQSLSGNDDFYLGQGQSATLRDTRPDNDTLVSEVVPGLLHALKGTDNQDLITASLMALGKIGLDPDGETQVERVLQNYLANSNQEIAETAAVALGLLGRSHSAPTLTALIADNEQGRRLVGRKQVPYRTRAFAAYGLGQLGANSDRIEVRTLAVRTLFGTLRHDSTPTPDLSTACLLSIGLCPLKSVGDWDPDKSAPRSVSSLEGQIAWLLAWFGEKGQLTAVRTHAPMSLARLAMAGGESHRKAVGEGLLLALARRGLDREVERAIFMALGHLGDADDDPVDARIRVRLQQAARSADGPSRALARVSLARVLSRPGLGDGADEALEQGRSWLLESLARGKSSTRPWTAMALGILAYERRMQGLPVSPSLTTALRSSLGNTQSPRDVGAFCIALGLTGDPKAKDVLLARLEKHADDGLRASAALGLGLLGATEARSALQALMAGAEHRPTLLRELSTALILIGDRSALPQLVSGLREAKTLAEQSSHAFAIGRIGDKRAVAPLLELLKDTTLSESTRAFAAAALGVVGHDSDLPWNALLASDLQYGQTPASLADGSRGVLDLL